MKYSMLIIGFCALALTINAQQRTGINTTNPQRALDVSGTGVQYMRVHAKSGANKSGVEFVLGNPGGVSDWSVTNDDGNFRISTTDGPIGPFTYSPIVIDPDGNFAVGDALPDSPLHIQWGNMVSNSGNAYLRIGEAGGPSLLLDRQGLHAANAGASSSLYMQTIPGWTYFGRYNPSSTYVVDGNVSIGANLSEARLNINTSNWQMILKNYELPYNSWRIGASSAGWSGIGDDKLVFSPTVSADQGVLVLSTISDNDGTDAPIMLRTSDFQSLLMDGNEIDSKTALFINYNNAFNTYFNVNGGNVGIGTTNPLAKLHIKSNVAALAVEQPGLMWQLALQGNGDIGFYNYNGLVALINWANGGWVVLSDSTKKAAIRPLKNATNMIEQVQLKTYTYKHDATSKQDMGVIAQELVSVVPHAVYEMDGQYGVAYDQLSALAVKGIQEQQTRIEALLELAKSTALE